jgi:putative salt-induced outer membrane protein
MMRRMTDGFRLGKAALLLTLTLLPLLPHVAFAQTPPAAPAPAAAPAPPPPPPLREGSAEFAFVGTSGNSSTQTIGLGGEFIYRPAPWETKLKIAYVRNESQDQITAQSFNLAFRAARPLRPKLSAFGQYAYQRDRFAGILSRNAVEGGVAYSWIDQKPHKLVVDAGLGYAHETRLIGENLSTATFGTGGIYTWKISATSELSEDGHFVFSLSDGADWRYANAIALTAKITSLLSLKVSNTIRYVNEPVASFKNTDSITAIALVAKF